MAAGRPDLKNPTLNIKRKAPTRNTKLPLICLQLCIGQRNCDYDAFGKYRIALYRTWEALKVGGVGSVWDKKGAKAGEGEPSLL